MPTWIKQILAPPVFEGDEDKTRVARLLNTILLFILAVLVAVTAVVLVLIEEPLTGLLFIGIIALATLGTWFLLRLGRVRLASGIFVTTLCLVEIGVLILTGGLQSPTAAGFIVFVIVAALLLGRFGAIAFGGVIIVAGLGAYLAEINGIMPSPLAGVSPQLGLINLVGNVGLAALLLYLAIGSLDEALDRARQQAGELAEQREHLEEAVEARTQDLTRRTRYLEATAAIAHYAALELDIHELLSRVVLSVSEQFGFYHTGLFFLSPDGEWLVLQAASSEGGQRMLDQGHRLRVGEGIVGYAAQHRQHRLALDVGADAVFFDNPDLPGTRSEVALPLQARGEVIGVLDVQSTEPQAFSEEDVAALEALANQVSVALSNARLFYEAQQALEAERRAYGQLSREAWLELLRTEQDLGYLSRRRDTVPAGDLWRAEMEAAISRGETALGDEGSRTVAIPLKIGDQVVGVVDGRKADGSGTWRAEEIELLEALTEQLNVALEGARLYQATQRRAARERLASEITARMRERLDVEHVLRTAVEEIAGALGLAALDLRIVREPGDGGNGDGSLA